uniref:Helicase C-terminal domain-containing protein n=1 Tax=Panagrolaimus sp. JU765 TaxID=591449 RepID=A0AC34RJX7_9BILA
LSLTAIVFLERKCSVVALCNLLRYLAQKGPRFNFIKADCTVGTGSQGIDAADGTETIRFKSKNLTDAIANFRTGQTNVMISTRVLEEGIDIRSCNLIIKGNIPSTYSSYVQSRGRARMSPSLYIMLCPFTEMTAGQSKISAYRRIEKLLTDRLPSWKNIAPERTTMTMDITPDDVLPPYVVPTDMAVALIACQVLHERGELDDNLLPLTKDKVANLLELADEFEEYAANVPRKTGSSKKRRVYARCIAKALSEALPNPGQEFHIYLIEMDLVEPISEQSNPKKRKIINPKNTPYIFGLCTTKKFPPIPPFPVYQRQGKVIAKFKLYKEKMVLNADELEL